jgi:DUF1365 family protein
MKSAVYEGTVRHARRGPVRHRFAYPIAMPFLDLAEIDAVFARHRLWSIERRNAVSFRRADFLGDPSVPLDTAVRELVEARTGRRPRGPIRLLAHVRTWGWLFNPIALYFCMDECGEGVEAVVLEVTNTPWHERHAYVVEGGGGEHRFGKALHVSPFLEMDQEYRLRLTTPGDSLVVRLANLQRGEEVFEATLALRRREVDAATLGRLLWRYPLLTLRVSTGIYWQALRLWAKGTPWYRHPLRVRRAPAAGVVGR